MEHHRYEARVVWDGNRGDGTSGYAGYSRRFRALVDGKPDLTGSADVAFRGDADRHDPEDLFLAAISACHMLTYLALCSRKGVRVMTYEDAATGRMSVDPDGGGRFDEVTLRPSVTVAAAEMAGRAKSLHETAHSLCFIASSCRVPIRVEPEVHVMVETVTR